MSKQIFSLYAQYNSWFNNHLLALLSFSAHNLDTEAKQMAAGAILRQLNHIFVMDLIWLRRFEKALDAANDPEVCLRCLSDEPHFMEQIFFWRFEDIIEPRSQTDKQIELFTESLTELRSQTPVTFRTLSDSVTVTRPLWALLLHLFNHQSLHRGEILAHLSHLKIDFGSTDILPLTVARSTEGSHL